MSALCLYFQVHQPYRVRKYRIFDIGRSHEYFSDSSPRLSNKTILNKVSEKCYLPTNNTLLRLLKKHPQFKISFSLSGVLLDQLQEFAPAVLDSFKKLVGTGRAEILCETYFHSLSFIYSPVEFTRQVNLHKAKIKSVFGLTPLVFRNTELIYSNSLAERIAKLRFKAVLAEGADNILGWRSPNYLYHPPGLPKLKLLLKNYRLSDDIAFRFSDKSWSQYPLTAPKFASWVNAVNGGGDIVNLFMDYETFGEHQWADTGIFEFMDHLPGEILKHQDNYFVTPSQAADKLPSRGELDVPFYVSWADVERDLSAWTGNPMQDDALSKLYALEKLVLRTKDSELIADWRRLQTSDHFYYMCTKWFSDGDVHKYFNPYDSPYEAFISFMNVLSDLKLRLSTKISKSEN